MGPVGAVERQGLQLGKRAELCVPGLPRIGEINYQRQRRLKNDKHIPTQNIQRRCGSEPLLMKSGRFFKFFAKTRTSTSINTSSKSHFRYQSFLLGIWERLPSVRRGYLSVPTNVSTSICTFLILQLLVLHSATLKDLAPPRDGLLAAVGRLRKLVHQELGISCSPALGRVWSL